ncbi:hypothetical protein V1512DRAFT_268407 [Lipomyces arxii]|uniref:uncharacterized protein n=1 Tax=Lipomyces arxii TaxID=56418 RepID=UPI0034CE59F1
MVSFSCEVCNDTIVKKKLMQHRSMCHGAYFTCLDCQTTFQGLEFQNHTSCISEAEKYQKSLYKAPTKKSTKGPSEKTKVVTETVVVKESVSEPKTIIVEKKEETPEAPKKEVKLEEPKKLSKKAKKVAKKAEKTVEKTDKEAVAKSTVGETKPVVEAEKTEIKAPVEKKNGDKKRKNEEISEEPTEISTEATATSDNKTEIVSAVTPKPKKTKYNKKANAGKTETQMPNATDNAKATNEASWANSDLRKQVQNAISKGGKVSLKALMKKLRRQPITHGISKAALMRRLLIKADGDQLSVEIGE